MTCPLMGDPIAVSVKSVDATPLGFRDVKGGNRNLITDNFELFTGPNANLLTIYNPKVSWQALIGDFQNDHPNEIFSLG